VRLAFAMLADAATVADGKLYVHGGGWSHLFVDGVPTRHPSFALVFALEMNGREPPGRIPLDFELVAGDAPVAGVRGWIGVPGERGPELGPVLVTNQATFTDVPLAAEGSYVVRVSSGGEELGRLDLHVVRREEPPADRS
jgi:hypothetical protein